MLPRYLTDQKHKFLESGVCNTILMCIYESHMIGQYSRVFKLRRCMHFFRMLKNNVVGFFLRRLSVEVQNKLCFKYCLCGYSLPSREQDKSVEHSSIHNLWCQTSHPSQQTTRQFGFLCYPQATDRPCISQNEIFQQRCIFHFSLFLFIFHNQNWNMETHVTIEMTCVFLNTVQC